MWRLLWRCSLVNFGCKRNTSSLLIHISFNTQNNLKRDFVDLFYENIAENILYFFDLNCRPREKSLQLYYAFVVIKSTNMHDKIYQSCSKGKGTRPRHASLNTLFQRAIRSEEIPAILEPLGCKGQMERNQTDWLLPLGQMGDHYFGTIHVQEHLHAHI